MFTNAGGEVRIIPQHIRNKYSFQGFNIDILKIILSKVMKVWSKLDSREMLREELVNIYIYAISYKESQ